MKKILIFIFLALMIPAAVNAAETYIDSSGAYIFAGDNLFDDPCFDDHSAGSFPQWYVGSNKTSSWNGEIPNPKTGENLTPLKGSAYIAETETPRLFYYSTFDGEATSCLSEGITSAARCWWNGVDSLLGFVKIDPAKTYYFSVRVYAASGKSASVRYGAINSGGYCSAADGSVSGLTEEAPAVGSQHKIEAIITPSPDSDYFMFNAYNLSRSEKTSFTEFTLVEVTPCDLETAERINQIGDYITDYCPSVVEITDENGFIHPGITMTKADLDRMQTHVRNADEPWLAAFLDFAALSKSQKEPRIHYGDASDIYDYENISTEFAAIRMRYDSDTCYAQTIMWYITGDDVYRENAMYILRKWSSVKSILHDDDRYAIDNEQLHFGVAMYKLSFAAEILRYSDYDRNPELVWTQADTAAFTNLLELSYPKYNRWWHFMNQHGINNMAFMASAIFRSDSEDFASAVERTTVNSAYDNPRNGSIISVIREVTYRGQTNIQHCEMGRDQGHAYGDIGALSICAMTAERQGAKVDPVTGELTESPNGISVFDFADHRLLFGANYISEYNLGYTVPYLPVEVDEKADAMWYYSINNTNRGLLYPNIGILYNYYKYERGWNMDGSDIQYLTRAYELMFPEGESDDFLGNSTLLFSGEAALGTVYPSTAEISSDTDMRKHIENRTYAVLSGDVEILTEADAAFLRFDGNGETSFIVDDFYPAYGSLSLRLRTTAAARIELRNSEPDEEPFTVFDIPSTNGEWLTVTELMGDREYWQRMTYFTVITDGIADLDWIEFSENTSLPVAEPEYSKTYFDANRAYMYNGAQYVLAIASGQAYDVSSTIPMQEFDDYIVLRPNKTGVQKIYIALDAGGATRYICREIYVFDDVEELIEKTTVNHRLGGSYTAGSMKRYLAAADALRAVAQPASADFVTAANALRLADDQNNLAALPGEAADEPILHYDFNRISHGKVADVSPYGNDGAPLGVTISGGKAIFEDGAYILMPEGLLAGADEITVAVTFESEVESSYAWLWSIADSSETGYVFFAPSRPNGKAYTAVTRSTYNNESSASAAAVPTGQRTTAVTVIGGGKIRLYINGRLAAEGNCSVAPSELGSAAMNYIGKSAFASDPAFEGSVSDFRIYNRALSAGEIAALDVPEDESPLKLIELTRDNSSYAYEVSCDADADIFAALYAADGSLLDVSEGEAGVLNGENAAWVKIFAWEKGSLCPIGMAVVNNN